MTENVQITAFDPNTGDRGEMELGEFDYFVGVGAGMEVTGTQRFKTGTIQVTIKRKRVE